MNAAHTTDQVTRVDASRDFPGAAWQVTATYEDADGDKDTISLAHLTNLAQTGGDKDTQEERAEVQARAADLLRQAHARARRWSPLTARPRGEATARGGEMVLTVDWTGERVTVDEVLDTHDTHRRGTGGGPVDAEARCEWAADLLGKWGHTVTVGSRIAG